MWGIESPREELIAQLKKKEEFIESLKCCMNCTHWKGPRAEVERCKKCDRHSVQITGQDTSDLWEFGKED